MSRSNEIRNRRTMDGETAMAFAGHCFQQLHPKTTCPEWLGRCTTVSYTKDDKQRYIVSFALTPNATKDAVSYFRVLVDPNTGETSVLLDRTLVYFMGPELQGFDPPARSPWSGA